MTAGAFCERTGKARYPTLGAAELVMNRKATRTRGRKALPRQSSLSIYHCRSCGGYHLGRKQGHKT